MEMLSTVVNTTEVLKVFSADQPELSLAEISKRTRLNKSAIFRILSTLSFSGFLEKDPDTSRYRLGLIFLDLANRVLDRYDLRDQARPYIEALAKRIGEFVHLSILDGSDIVYLDKAGQSQPLTVATRIGGRSPAHGSATGKVLLAGLSNEELAKVLGEGPLKKLTDNTITAIPAMLEELERVRKQGYALDDEETFLDIRCVAAPIQDNNGDVIAAISATAPKQRMKKRRRDEIRRLVTETARSISEQSVASNSLRRDPVED